MVVANHVMQQVPPDRLTHVFEGVDRVLPPGVTFLIRIPHTGSWDAPNGPSHCGQGGWTPGVTRDFTGELEPFWPDLDWDLLAWANIKFITFLRPERRMGLRIGDGGCQTNY